MIKNRADEKSVTLDDVAKHAGVSKSTASLVVRNSTLIKADTHKKVRKSMKSLGYIYNHSAASLRTRRTRTLGMIIADIGNPFYAQLAAGIQTTCHDLEFLTIFADTQEDGKQQGDIVRQLIEHNVAGVFLCPAGDGSKNDIETLKRAGIPTILIMRYIEEDLSSYVGPDNLAGMKLITKHLADYGHKEIAYIGGPKRRSSSTDRLDGIQRGMVERELLLRDDWTFSSEINKESGFNACDALLSSGAKPTAIACYNDIIALGVMLNLLRRGLKPGVDISVTGFDDILESKLWTPSLTTVSIDAKNIGSLAATELLSQINDPSRSQQKIIVQPQLTIRNSSQRLS